MKQFEKKNNFRGIQFVFTLIDLEWIYPEELTKSRWTYLKYYVTLTRYWIKKIIKIFVVIQTYAESYFYVNFVIISVVRQSSNDEMVEWVVVNGILCNTLSISRGKWLLSRLENDGPIFGREIPTFFNTGCTRKQLFYIYSNRWPRRHLYSWQSMNLFADMFV